MAPKKRDPGMPSAWPLKAELIAEANLHARRDIEVAEARKVARAAHRERGVPLDAAPATPPPPPPLASDASRRAFGGELARVIAEADIIVQVLDARDPASCRCAALERAVARAPGAPKTLVFLLNKVDLVPPAAAAAWLAVLRRDAPAVAFKAATGASGAVGRGAPASGRGRGAKRRRGAPGPGGDVEDADGRPLAGAATCVGADALLRLLRGVARARGAGAMAVVGIVGLPNVGKSSVVNSLKRARVARTGNAPGVTRAAQTIRLDASLTLLDSPGVVLRRAAGSDAAADLALRGCVADGGAAVDARAVAAAALARAPPRALAAHYRVPPTDDPDELLRALAIARGKLRPGGVPDADAAARVLAADWRAGRVPYYTLPPSTPAPAAGDDAAIVAPAAGVDLASLYEEADGGALEGRRAAVLAPGSVPAAAAAATPRYFLAAPAGAPAEDEAVVKPASDKDGDSSEDEGATDSDGDAAPAALQPALSKPAPSQAAALYSAPGQFNPVAARATRKAAKRASRGAKRGVGDAADELAAALAVGSGAGGDAYDFGEAFGGEGGGEGVSSGNDSDMGDAE